MDLRHFKSLILDKFKTFKKEFFLHLGFVPQNINVVKTWHFSSKGVIPYFSADGADKVSVI